MKELKPSDWLILEDCHRIAKILHDKHIGIFVKKPLSVDKRLNANTLVQNYKMRRRSRRGSNLFSNHQSSDSDTQESPLKKLVFSHTAFNGKKDK